MREETNMAKGIDLTKLSLDDLKALAQDVEVEIVGRREAERSRVLDQMRELAGSLGMTLEDVIRGEKGKSGTVAAKYRNPDNPDLTWSGRGKRPAWVNEALASGKTLEDLAA
jgi:DNA-binding protein H-NS